MKEEASWNYFCIGLKWPRTRWRGKNRYCPSRRIKSANFRTSWMTTSFSRKTVRLIYKRRVFFVQFDPLVSRFHSFTNKIKSLTALWGFELLLLFVLIHGSLAYGARWNTGEGFRLVTNSCSPGQTCSVCPTDFFLSVLPWQRCAWRISSDKNVTSCNTTDRN